MWRGAFRLRRLAASPASTKGALVKKSWLLAPIAFSAFVATWGGWVTMAELCGYGKVNLLPGLVDDDSWSTVNLAISLPLGVEAYGALALAVAFDEAATRGARWFGGLSAAMSLTLAGVGQAIVHNLVADHKTVAPAGVVTFVSILPVFVLGMASILAVLSQGRAAEASQTASRKVSQWAGMLGRLAEAGTNRLVSQLERPAGTSQRDDRDASRDDRDVPAPPIPTFPAPAGMGIPAAQPPAGPSVPVPAQSPPASRGVALNKRPEVVGQVAGMLAESPGITVDQIAAVLGVSRSAAGRVVKAAREQAEPAGPLEVQAQQTEINGKVPQLEGAAQ